MFSSRVSSANEDEFEETVFMIELQGLFDPDTIEHDTNQGRCRVANLDGDQPVIQIGSSVFVGRWETTPGTDLLFREIAHRQMLSFIGSSEKRLVAQRVLLNSKRKRRPEDEEDDDEEAAEDDDDQREDDEEEEEEKSDEDENGIAAGGRMEPTVDQRPAENLTTNGGEH